jgi:hypothetical protein
LALRLIYDIVVTLQRIGLSVLAIPALAPPVVAAPMVSSTTMVAPTDSSNGLSSVELSTPAALFSTAMLNPTFQTGRNFSGKFCVGTSRGQNVPPAPFNTVASSTVSMMIPQPQLRLTLVSCDNVLTFTVGSEHVGIQTAAQTEDAAVWSLGWLPFYPYVPYRPAVQAGGVP